MIKQTIFCDVCTLEKTQDGWWQVQETPQYVNHAMFRCDTAKKPPSALIIRPYEEDAGQQHWNAACGVVCLNKLIGMYIEREDKGVRR